jgi:hypothetical protein
MWERWKKEETLHQIARLFDIEQRRPTKPPGSGHIVPSSASWLKAPRWHDW